MALDRSGISVEGRTLLSSLKSRDFKITVRVLLTEPKLSVSEIIQMTASKALDGTHCILPSRASLGTEVNVIADGFSSIPEGLNDYPSGHTVLLLVTPNSGSEVCLMGASCDETIVADSRLHLLINLEETDGIFNPSVDFDSYVPQGIINDMFSSMKDSLDQYVTVGTKQTVTGQKVFTGTINVSSLSDADNVYLQIQTGGDKNTQSPVSSLYFWDKHRNVLGGIGFESSRNGTNQFLTSYVRRYANNYNDFVSGVVDQKVVSNHYNVLVDDSCVFFESSSSSEPLVGAWHEAARALSDYYVESEDIGRQQAATYSSTDDYRERIRLRRVLYQEQITDTPKGTVKTYVDLYAQNITNVADTVKFQYTENETYTIKFWDKQSEGIVVKTVEGPVPHDLLTISKGGGVYSTHFRGGYEIDNTSYSFGSAGSLTFETSIPVNADNAHLPTSSAVKDYVDSSVSLSINTTISDLSLGTASTKDFSTDMNTPENLPTTSAITSYISNQGFATTSQIPTQTSKLTNDSGFITAKDLPNVPDVVSAFTNDAGYITSAALPTKTSNLTNDSGFITKSDIPQIPSKTSDLTNDSEFITKSSLPTKVSDLRNDLGFITNSDGSITNKALASEAVYSGTYDSNSKKILLKNKANTTLAEIDATAFIKDGMVSQVEVSNGNLVITFNTDAGKNPISVPISDIFDANNYYTKTEADSKFLTSHQSLSNYVTFLPTDSTFTHDLNVSYGVFSGLNFLMMDTEGNWYPFLARNAAESSASPISGKSFDVSQIVWDASSGHSDEGSGVFFSSHPKASIKHLMPYISWKKPCDLCRHDSQQKLYSDFDLYMRSCAPSRENDVRTLVTSILDGHISSGGEILGTVETCVASIMTSVSQGRFPIFICSKYREGAWEALRDRMYTIHPCDGVTAEDKFAEFVQYKSGAPVWLNLQRNDAGGLYPLHLSFCPCVYSDLDRFYDTDACVLVGFMNGVDNLNFIQNHPVYYNAGSDNEVDLRPYNVKEKLVDADVQGSFVGNISLPYGTCYTERSTDAKVVNSLDDFPRSEFQDGDLIFVRFENGNTSTHPTLNIKDTGAVAVRTNPSTYLGNVPEGDTLLLRYDTGYNSNNPSDTWYKTWYVVSSSGSSNLYTARTVDGVSFDGSANVTHYCTCYTDSDTAEKTVSVTGFVLEEGARVTVNFSESNTAANPTLNVHSGNAYTGAKAIMYRGTSSVSGSSDYYRWQAGDIIDFIYDGTNWVMVGWQTHAYYAESATSASTSTYATHLRYSTTNLLTASDTSTVTSSATIRPSSNGGSSLGSPSYKWGAVYANFIGSSTYPVVTAYIETMQGTASRATSDTSGNIIASTYLKSVTLVNSSGKDLTSSGKVGVNETGTYVVPSNWPVLLRLTKGSETTTDIGLRSLLCSYLMGIPKNNASTSSSSPLGVSGAIGCLAILQVYRTSPSDTIPRGRLVSSYSTVSVRGIETAGESGHLEWSSHPVSISGTWVAINHTTASSGSYNYCMVLAVRIY